MKRMLAIPVLLAASCGWAQLIASHSSTAVSPTTAPSRPVARVNGAVLTDRDLLREEYTIFPYARQHNGVPKGMEADIRAGAMKMMVFEELLYQEAVRQKMTIPAERLQRAEAEFRRQFTNSQDYDEVLQTEFSGSKALLRAKIKRSLLIEKMLKLKVDDRSNISLAEARAFYNQNPSRFLVPESYAVQTISIIPPSNANPAQAKEARKKAEDALRQAQQTKTYEQFGLLAEKISEDDYRVMMGDHRAVDREKLPPAVLQAVQGMKPYQISGLIDIGNHGYTIVRLNAHVPAGKKKFEEVKDSLREYLKKQRTEQLRSALDQQLRKNAKVEEL